MKRKMKVTSLIALLLCCILSTGALAGCNNSENASASTKDTGEQSSQVNASMSTSTEEQIPTDLDMNVEPTRLNYVALAEELEKLYQQNPDDAEAALAYTEKLLQLGDVDRAKAVLSSIPDKDAENPQAIYLLAQINYICGNYKQAEVGYDTLLREYSDYKVKAELGLEYVYYQTNQYQKTETLSGENTSASGIYNMMQAFGERKPYQVNWDGEQSSIVPFMMTDPLPLVELEVNGVKKVFIIDTGASETYINESVAEALGLQVVATTMGEYAGGIAVESQFAILDSLKLGSATVENVPVIMANIDHFTPLFGDDIELGGIIGTGLFHQFYVRMDYIDGALHLMPRSENRQIAADAVAIPFIMPATHFMMSKATINGKDMNMFLDSGLAAEESLLLPDASIEYAGVNSETIETPDDYVGGLGGATDTYGVFTVDSYEMGDLPVVNNMSGLADVFPEFYYFNKEIGVFADGIISHTYLREYVWTIDFDSMIMTFAK